MKDVSLSEKVFLAILSQLRELAEENALLKSTFAPKKTHSSPSEDTFTEVPESHRLQVISEGGCFPMSDPSRWHPAYLNNPSKSQETHSRGHIRNLSEEKTDPDTLSSASHEKVTVVQNVAVLRSFLKRQNEETQDCLFSRDVNFFA